MWTFLNGKWFFAPENEGGAGSADPEEGEEDDLVEDPEDGEEPALEEEPEEGAEPEEGDEGDEPLPAKKETRVQRLANEARTEREKRIRLEAQLEERSRTPQQPVNNDAERIRAEKIALMTPEEKNSFLAVERAERVERKLELQEIQMTDFRDEAKYDAVAATDSVKGRAYAKHKAWVENELLSQRKLGRNPSRELLIRVKLGDEQLNAKPGKALAKKKASAAGRVASAKGAPLSVRGGAGSSSSKGDSLADLKARILAREARGEAG